MLSDGEHSEGKTSEKEGGPCTRDFFLHSSQFGCIHTAGNGCSCSAGIVSAGAMTVTRTSDGLEGSTLVTVSMPSSPSSSSDEELP